MRGPVDKFLDTQAFGLRSRYTYAGVLRAFEAFVLERESSNRPSQETLRTWLQQDAQRSPLANVASRVCVIACYLDWCSTGGERSHVLAQLRGQYGRRLTPIVRALLEDDYGRALEVLRPLRPWGSVIGADMQEHVMRMQGLGYRYEVRERDLLRFDRFLQRQPALAAASLQEQLEAWRCESRGVRHLLRVQQCGQILSKAQHRKDPVARVLPVEAGLSRRVVQQERRPYLFSETEIERLLEAARTFPSHNAPLRPIAVHAMITLAYCAGLRLGEVASLTLGDLDQQNGLCPLWPETAKLLAALLKRQPRLDHEPLFVNRYGQPLGAAGVRFKLAQYVKAAAEEIPSLRKKRVHPHTFRHTAGVQLVAAGVDVTVIRSWLGHVRLDATNHYARANLETKRRAIEQVDRSTRPGSPPRWRRNPDLLNWLDSL